MSTYHIPIMVKEVTEWLDIQPKGVYIDATFGGGGHSAAILEKLDPEFGRLLVFDQDKTALEKNLPTDKRITAIHANFIYIKHFLAYLHIDKVHGILADIGVSSYQFDTGERGFSIMHDGPLDMRMNRNQLLTAQHIIEHYSPEQLKHIFQYYGEITNTNRLVALIINTRQKMKIETTKSLVKLIEPIAVGKHKMQYLAQVFQALRIEVNNELIHLQRLMDDSATLLAEQGRMVVITFHSLEDRIVKQTFKNHVHSAKIWEPVVSRSITASDAEIRTNTRARSARLRVGKRINTVTS